MKPLAYHYVKWTWRKVRAKEKKSRKRKSLRNRNPKGE
jgi:hypothetical protein